VAPVTRSKTQSGLNVNHFRTTLHEGTARHTYFPVLFKSPLFGAPKGTILELFFMNLWPACHSSRLNPHEYLTDVPARLPSTKITGIHELLPAHWKPQPSDTT